MNEAQLIKALNRAQELMNDSSFNSLVENKSRNINFDNSGNVVMNMRENLSHEELVNEFPSLKHICIINQYVSPPFFALDIPAKRIYPQEIHLKCGMPVQWIKADIKSVSAQLLCEGY